MLDQETEIKLRKRILKQTKQAKDIVFYLRSISDKKVNYYISTKIILEGGNVIPRTTITELPLTHVYHSLSGDSDNEIVEYDIDNMEG